MSDELSQDELQHTLGNGQVDPFGGLGGNPLPPRQEPLKKYWGFAVLDEFLDAHPPRREWIVPGVLEKGARLIVTGDEGCGKSVLLRQMMYQAGQGVHWFTGEPVEPLRTGLLDLENPEDLVHWSLSELRARRGPQHERSRRMVVRCSPEGLDILDTSSDDARMLREFVHVNKMQLLVVGPLYKLVGGNENDNERAKAAAAVLDQVRAQGCAVVMEAHCAKAADDRRQHRPKEPVGASTWMRWPEYGLHLGAEGHLTHWRGPRGAGRFPARLTRHGDWLWNEDRSRAAGQDEDYTERRCTYNAIAQNDGLLSGRQVAEVVFGNPRARRADLLIGQLIQRGLIRREKVGSSWLYWVTAPWPESEEGTE